VATSFSEDIQGFSDVIEVADSESDFCRKITAAICNDTENSRQQRITIASGNNWEDRAKKFWEIVRQVAQPSAHSNSMAPMS
jgi:hypothetical protein